MLTIVNSFFRYKLFLLIFCWTFNDVLWRIYWYFLPNTLNSPNHASNKLINVSLIVTRATSSIVLSLPSKLIFTSSIYNKTWGNLDSNEICYKNVMEFYCKSYFYSLFGYMQFHSFSGGSLLKLNCDMLIRFSDSVW